MTVVSGIDAVVGRVTKLADEALALTDASHSACNDLMTLPGILLAFRKGRIEREVQRDVTTAASLLRTARTEWEAVPGSVAAREHGVQALHHLESAAGEPAGTPAQAASLFNAAEDLRRFRTSYGPSARAEDALRSGRGIEWLRDATAVGAPRESLLLALELRNDPRLAAHPAVDFLRRIVPGVPETIETAHVALSGDLSAASKRVVELIDRDAMSPQPLDVRLAVEHLEPEDAVSPAGRFWSWYATTLDTGARDAAAVRRLDEIADTPDEQLTLHDVRAMYRSHDVLFARSGLPDWRSRSHNHGLKSPDLADSLRGLRRWSNVNRALESDDAVTHEILLARLREIVAKQVADVSQADRTFLAELDEVRDPALRLELPRPYRASRREIADGARGLDMDRAVRFELDNLRMWSDELRINADPDITRSTLLADARERLAKPLGDITDHDLQAIVSASRVDASKRIRLPDLGTDSQFPLYVPDYRRADIVERLRDAFRVYEDPAARAALAADVADGSAPPVSVRALITDQELMEQLPASTRPILLRRWAGVLRDVNTKHLRAIEPSIKERLELALELLPAAPDPTVRRNVDRVRELVDANLARVRREVGGGYRSHPEYGDLMRIAHQLELIARKQEIAQGVATSSDPGTVSWT